MEKEREAHFDREQTRFHNLCEIAVQTDADDHLEREAAKNAKTAKNELYVNLRPAVAAQDIRELVAETRKLEAEGHVVKARVAEIDENSLLDETILPERPA